MKWQRHQQVFDIGEAKILDILRGRGVLTNVFDLTLLTDFLHILSQHLTHKKKYIYIYKLIRRTAKNQI